VTISLRGPRLPDADELPSQGLRPEEFAKRYSARQQDADTVAAALQGYGLTVDDVSLVTRSMRVSGPASAMNASFRANLGIYHSPEQGDFRGRDGALQIPAALDGIVTGVFGLDQRRVARRKAMAARAALAPLGPAELQAHYNFPPGDGSGQKIGIAEFGGGYFANDLTTFCAKHGLPVAAVTPVAVDATPLTLAQIKQLPPTQRNEELDESAEVMMDVQIIAGLCPGAQISVYFSTFDQKGWVDLLNQAIKDVPVTLSISWGLAEDSGAWSQAALTAINERLSAAATLGITVCVSSGDDGSGDQVPGSRAHVDFPAASPYALACGGTTLQADPDSGAVHSEVVWFHGVGQGGTGGGVSDGDGSAGRDAAATPDDASCCPIAIPRPAATLAPPTPGLRAASRIASAAWSCAYAPTSPMIPIRVRWSSVPATSSGSEMFSITTRVISSPYVRQRTATRSSSRSPSSTYRAASSSTDTGSSASRSLKRETTRLRSCSAISSTSKRAFAPTSSSTKRGASFTRTAYCP